MIGYPATGNKGLGSSSDSGRKRVPLKVEKFYNNLQTNLEIMSNIISNFKQNRKFCKLLQSPENAGRSCKSVCDMGWGLANAEVLSWSR
jgi:hypothetical protein